MTSAWLHSQDVYHNCQAKRSRARSPALRPVAANRISLVHPGFLALATPIANPPAPLPAPALDRPALATALRRQPLAVFGLVLLVLFVVLALLAPFLAPYNPAALDLLHRLAPPSHAHWLGTDELGRDILSRVIFGARLSLTVAVSVVALSLGAGLVLGGIAGYYGRWLDVAINTFLMNAFMALPGILLAIAFVAFLGPGLLNLILALSIGGWVGYARLVRAQVLAVREREFVEAARALGASDLRIFVRHILPNILQPLIVQAAIGMAGAVLAEATLSFLGLGVPPPAASWGSMLNDARPFLFNAPHLVIFPAVAVMLCVLSFNFLGDALRDYLDPRTRIAIGL
jgi:peptide/nickel transport system permease protein